MVLQNKYCCTDMVFWSFVLFFCFLLFSSFYFGFLMPSNDFLVKLFLIWWVIYSSCAMMESFKSSWSWLLIYLSLCGSVLIFLANLSFSFQASLNFESKQLLRSWNNFVCSPLRMLTSPSPWTLRHFFPFLLRMILLSSFIFVPLVC